MALFRVSRYTNPAKTLDRKAGLEPARELSLPLIQSQVGCKFTPLPKKLLVGRPGFEPGTQLSESRVMPLH